MTDRGGGGCSRAPLTSRNSSTISGSSGGSTRQVSGRAAAQTRGTRGARCDSGAVEGGLTGRSSSCCPDKRRPSLETLPKVLALHFVAVSHAGNIPKALAVVGCRLCVSGLLFVAVVAR